MGGTIILVYCLLWAHLSDPGIIPRVPKPDPNAAIEPRTEWRPCPTLTLIPTLSPARNGGWAWNGHDRDAY